MQASATLERAQRRVAAAGGRHIGDLISWNTERIDVSREAVRRLFATEALGHLIPNIEPATALSRAAGEMKRPPGIIVRPFAKPKDDTSAAFGIYQVKPGTGEGGDKYVCGARCRVDRATNIITPLAPEGAPPIDELLAHAEAMAAHANHIITHCETKDLSLAMVGAAKALSGVPLRDRGGFYLLPPTTCPAWARLKPGLEQLGVKPIRIEMHDAPDNVAVAKAAAQGALEADIADLMQDLDKAGSEGMRQHALTRRVEICRELMAKAELYRGVLAGVADQITAKAQDLQRRLEKHLTEGDGVSFSVPVKD